MMTCPICAGKGRLSLDHGDEFVTRPEAFTRCLYCDGSGQIKNKSRITNYELQGDHMKQKGKAVQPKVKGKKGLIVCRTCESTGLFGGNECPTCRGKGYLGTQARVRNADSGMIEQYRMLIRRPGFEGTSQEWALCETKNTARVVWLLPRPRKSGMMGQAGTHVPTGEKAGCDGQGKPSPYREQAGTHVPTSTDRVTAIVLVIRGAAADVREQIDQILHRKEK